MAAQGKRTPAKVSLDDTIPLKCTIENIKKKDHVEYIMKVQRGARPEDCWQVTHRYSDFSALHSILEVSGIELPLPPKKVFGNMDTAFISERQQGLQHYINFILAHHLLSKHISVKKFLDPRNYSENIQEKAVQQVAMFLRSVPNWEVVEPLPEIGWRLRRHYFLIKPSDPTKKDVRNVLTWTDYGPDFCLEEKDIEAAMKLLPSIQHPYLAPPSFVMANDQGSITVRNFFPNGTLRDCLCRAKPNLSQLKKYGSPKSRTCFQLNQIQLFGRQILEALKFLHEKGLPYGHLHAGNIVLDGKVCRLLDIENGLLGLPSFHRHRYVPFKKLQDKEAEDVYCFGHLLFEMAFAEPLRTSTLHEVPPACPPELGSVLQSILSEDSCNKNGLPSVSELLALPFFNAIDLPTTEKPVLKIPSKLKEAIRSAKEKAEQRLKDDQKFLRQLRRASKAHAHHMSEEEKKKRKKSAKKADSMPESRSGPEARAPPLSTRSASSAQAPSPPPPRPPQAPAAPPPPQAPTPTPPPAKTQGRGALLSSISSFTKTGLKKTTTNDRSAPKL